MKRLPLKPFLLVATLSAVAPALIDTPFAARVFSFAGIMDVGMADLGPLASTLHALTPVTLDSAFLADTPALTSVRTRRPLHRSQRR